MFDKHSKPNEVIEWLRSAGPMKTIHDRPKCDGKGQRRYWVLFFSAIVVGLMLMAGTADATPKLYMRNLWSNIVAEGSSFVPHWVREISGTSHPQDHPEISEPTQDASFHAWYQKARETTETPQAVPEPSGLILLGVGALGFAAYAWRARRKAA
jgi:hypothetical protein